MTTKKSPFTFNDIIVTPEDSGTPEYFERIRQGLAGVARDLQVTVGIWQTPGGDMAYGADALDDFQAFQLMLYGDMPMPRFHTFRLRDDSAAAHAAQVRVAVGELRVNAIHRGQNYEIEPSKNGMESVFCFDRLSHMHRLWQIALAHQLVAPQPARPEAAQPGGSIPRRNLH